MDQSTQNLNWVSVINFLQKQYTKSTIQEKQWTFEKQSLLDKINRLEGELSANQILTNDLLNRIKLLEVALIEARSEGKQARSKSLKKEDLEHKEVEKLIEKYNLEEKVKIKSHDQFLKKVMAEMKIDSKTLNLPRIRESMGLSCPTSKMQTKDQTISHFRENGKVIAHMDGIRKIIASENQNYITTISEDCLVKLWPYHDVFKNRYEHLQPSCTFRQHTGPLFALAGGRDPYNPENSLFFTGGTEGIIKCWRCRDRQFEESANPFGILGGGEGQGQEDTGVIWDLALKNDMLLSSNSDGFVRLYKIEEQLKSGQDWFKNKFRQKQFNCTSVCWLSSETFLAGHSNAPRAHLWDLNGKLCQKYFYQIEKTKDPQLFQINQILYNPSLKYIVSGCEDGNLRIFSHGFTKITRKIDTGHSISSIAFRKEWQIVAGMNNGSMGIWDIRNYKKIFSSADSHQCKFDEGIFCLFSDGDRVLSGGADGIINIYG